MTKTYTKLILGVITFFGALLGPISIVIQPTPNTQQADVNIPTIGFYHTIAFAGEEQGAVKTVTPTDTDLAATLEGFLKIIYVLLWPALFIAGLAMDNSLVYGEIFGLDGALFKFWQIMKNFANFALGFIFVWSILKYIFDLKGGKATNPKDIIVKLLLGAIGVNMSWFAVGAMVDLSTILTVGVGGLPLQLIGDQGISDKPIFGSKSSIKLNDTVSNGNIPILYTRPGSSFDTAGKYLLPCYIDNNKIQWDASRQRAFGVQDGKGNVTGTNVGWDQIEQEFCIARGHGISKTVYEDKQSPNVQESTLMKPVIEESLIAIQKKGNCENNTNCQTLKTFTKKTEGYQGAFYSLYASILNLSTIHIGVPKSNVSLGMEMLIKTIIALAYLIPLLILAVVLIMRVGYLWLIIAFSPFIVLASIKELGGGVQGKIKDETMKNLFDIKKVISLLLLPVIVTFTVSLSIVFLSSLSEGLTKNGTASSMGIYQRNEGSYKCYDVAITNICLDIPPTDIGTGVFDYFSWTIMNLFGIGLMWFSVMAALKSSDFTSKLAGTIETLGKDMMMSANVIPIPGGKEGARTSLGAIGGLKDDMKNRLDASKNEGTQILSSKISGMQNDMLGKDKAVNDAITNTTKEIASTASFTDRQTKLLDNIKTGKFNAAKDMNFGQADNSTAFANMLADKGGFTGMKFKNGQELFTTENGQKVLATWLNHKDGVQALDQLGAVYGNGYAGSDREDRKKKIEELIPKQTVKSEEIVLSTPTQTTPKIKYYKKGNVLLIGNEGKTQNTFTSEDELKATISDINQILKTDKDIDITRTGELTVGTKKYILQKKNGIVDTIDAPVIAPVDPTITTPTSNQNTGVATTTKVNNVPPAPPATQNPPPPSNKSS